MFDEMYTQGYIAGLQDAIQMIGPSMEKDLRVHGMKQNFKNARAILEVALRHRAELRENPDAFVRCNTEAKTGFEMYDGKRRRVIAEY